MVHSVRVQSGVVSYGAPYNKWTITFATVEGCTGDTIGSVEIDALPSATSVPTGATPLRTDQNTVTAVPSGFLSYMAGTLVSGTVTIDSATDGFTVGSLSAQMMVAGVATDVSGTFSAPTCR